MRKLERTTCQDNLVKMEDRLDDGRLISLAFRASRLDTNQHDIVRRNISTVQSIDGEDPYGAMYWNEEYIPKRFDLVTIRIGQKDLIIPQEAFSNLYNPGMCDPGGWNRAIEVYAESDRIYIYLYGGNAADSYFAKVIFDKDEYVATLVADYGPLPCYSAFRPQLPRLLAYYSARRASTKMMFVLYI